MSAQSCDPRGDTHDLGGWAGISRTVARLLCHGAREVDAGVERAIKAAPRESDMLGIIRSARAD